jgi:hypothetical protein
MMADFQRYPTHTNDIEKKIKCQRQDNIIDVNVSKIILFTPSQSMLVLLFLLFIHSFHSYPFGPLKLFIRALAAFVSYASS